MGSAPSRDWWTQQGLDLLFAAGVRAALAQLRLAVTIWDRQGKIIANVGGAMRRDHGIAPHILEGTDVMFWVAEGYPQTRGGFESAQAGRIHVYGWTAHESGEPYIMCWFPPFTTQGHVVSVSMPADVAKILPDEARQLVADLLGAT